MEPDAVEMRVLGCLIEKQRTTPDAYPLTLNSLRLACNQATAREPVVDYDERQIKDALERLNRRRWARQANWSSGRVMKYRHLLDEALNLAPPELALMGVLMLRGAQTPGELKQRTDRLHGFASADEVEIALDGLIERELVERLPRRPGQREQRYLQLLGDRAEGEWEREEDSPEPRPVVAEQSSRSEDAAPELERRVDRLEAEVRGLREELRGLRDQLGG